MKPVLLTLVVVTIVCLDLGYTRICLKQEPFQPETTTTCPEGEDACYNLFWSDHSEIKIEMGCGCPKTEPYTNLYCCKIDSCNK
uniref:Weak toxin DE-1 homolog 1 n=1 Tax=Ophiophagus hannah TaxID=8665 RepID=3S11H_OPHHA|nr:RecName: Full=Weak toxin DE-1 homolog 1; Short=WTX DE-1 homolog 1; Flags: Precursor [Ophiophagus hannah]AAR10442.1 weak toxin DE-1-like protein [Ophiophagus hannah]5XWE_A Chain A, Weak toxin DE-1 homolog 1 [Ophiophagus hannah]5XWE_B Chain B, Weak toxin DE-1 homolog 1 [Ophiophagus hannah]